MAEAARSDQGMYKGLMSNVNTGDRGKGGKGKMKHLELL